MIGFICFINFITIIFIFAILCVETKRENLIMKNLNTINQICEDIHKIINK